MSRSLASTRVRSKPRRAWRTGLVLALGLLLSGCIKYDLTVVVSDDDTMDGTLIVAVARTFAAGEDIFGQSQELTPSVGSISREAYEDEDYVGTRYVITGVPIAELDVLSTDSSTRYSLTREGDRYVLDIGLTFNLGGDAAPADDSFAAMVAFTFPGAVQESNGRIDGNSVTWTELRPDGDNNLTASASAISNGEAGSSGDAGIPWWVWVLGAVGILAVVGVIVAVVLRSRRRARRAAAAAEQGWPAQQPAGRYDAYGNWIPAAGYEGQYAHEGQYGHDAAGPDDGSDYYGSYGAYGDSYYGSDGGSYDNSYDNTYDSTYTNTYRHPSQVPPDQPSQTAPYGSGNQPPGGYSGQTVVGRPDHIPPPGSG